MKSSLWQCTYFFYVWMHKKACNLLIKTSVEITTLSYLVDRIKLARIEVLSTKYV